MKAPSLSPLSAERSVNALSAPITPARRVPVVDRSKVDPETIQAAEGMESMFIDYMMKVMRETVPKNDMDLESPATGVYRSMLDQSYADRAVRAGGVGLADQIIAYLESERYTGPQEHAAPNAGEHAAVHATVHGGTDEGSSHRK